MRGYDAFQLVTAFCWRKKTSMSQPEHLETSFGPWDTIAIWSTSISLSNLISKQLKLLKGSSSSSSSSPSSLFRSFHPAAYFLLRIRTWAWLRFQLHPIILWKSSPKQKSPKKPKCPQKIWLNHAEPTNFVAKVPKRPKDVSKDGIGEFSLLLEKVLRS